MLRIPKRGFIAFSSLTHSSVTSNLPKSMVKGPYWKGAESHFAHPTNLPSMESAAVRASRAWQQNVTKQPLNFAQAARKKVYAESHA